MRSSKSPFKGPCRSKRSANRRNVAKRRGNSLIRAAQGFSGSKPEKTLGKRQSTTAISKQSKRIIGRKSPKSRSASSHRKPHKSTPRVLLKTAIFRLSLSWQRQQQARAQSARASPRRFRWPLLRWLKGTRLGSAKGRGE